MDINDILARTGGLQSMARELGLSESQAQSGAAALLPAILGGFQKQTQALPGGFDGPFGDMLNQLGGSSLADDVMSPQPTNVSRGNDVLGQIFGSKDVSRTVAQDAAAKSGLDPSILKKMLPILAMLVSGYMARQRGASGGGGGVLGSILGGLLGGGGGGNPLDDILGRVGRR